MSTCPDCHHSVGWSQADGECPRAMQNHQSDACKARQLEWFKAQLSATEAKLAEAERERDQYRKGFEARGVILDGEDAQLTQVESKLAEAQLENRAWRALAEYVSADGHGCIDAIRGVAGCDLFVGVDADEPSGFEGTSCEKGTFGACALDIATKLGLLDKAGG